MSEESIYEKNDRVEWSIDTKKDLFDDVFGEDEEKKQARKRREEKAKELADKQKNNKKESNKINQDEITKNEKEFSKEEDIMIDEKEKMPNKISDEADIKNKEEPELFLDKEQLESIKKSKERLKILAGKKSNFNEIVKDGLEKSIQNGTKKEITPENYKSDFGGKLNLKVEIEEKNDEIILKKKKPLSDIEKNIVKNVIKNKANKVNELENDEMADYLLKEQDTKEEWTEPNWGFENEIQKIVKNKTNKEIEEEQKNKANIKPDLNLLEADSGNRYIGRKKGVLKKYGEEGGLFVGRVGEEELHHKPVYLDGLNPHVVFVCGARGSGKSYVLGVIAEELAIKNKNVGIVVVDPIGVFWSMKYPNRDEKELELLAEWNIMPQGLNNIKVFIPVGMKSSVPKSTYDNTFSIQPSLLTAEDWCLTFGMDRFSPAGLLLDKALEKVRKGFTTKDEENPKTIRGKENTYSLDDLIFCLDNDNEINGGIKGYKQESIRALVSRFDAAKSWGIFDESGTPLSLLSRAGQMTILDTSFLGDTVGALVIGIIARRLLSARKLSTRREAAGKLEAGPSEELVEINIPPTWLFIDEAHTLIPGGNAKTPASNAIVEYVKQGRRPGLSLVFATQQPSAIDSRVLSQLDVIMAHKLVFDDDVKAIHKRTPTIIPGSYKKPNFIKTLPVGTALTGDRQETTTRAFIMNIRPRMSQHEGRDAETVEVKHDLSNDQVEKLSINIVKNKLEKDPSIKIDLMEQILETLNATYKKNITIEQLLALIKKEGIDFDENRIYAKGVLEEKKQEEAEEKKELEESVDVEEINETDSNKEETNLDEENTDSNEEKPKEKKIVEEEYEESVELTALKPNVKEKDARVLLAKLRLKKKLGLFGEEEILDRLSLKYGIIYKLRFNYFSQKDAYQVGEAYLNSLTGEFIHDSNGVLIESIGLKDLHNLNEAEVLAIKLLRKKQDLNTLANGLSMEEGNAKRVLEKLATKDLVKIEKTKEIIFYSLKKTFDLPLNPLHSIMPSIGKRPIIEVETISMIPPKFSEKDSAELLKKLWRNITIKEITHLFLPVWEGVLKKKTGEERIAKIDAINGRQIK